MIGESAIVLLGHRRVEAAQTRLEVAHRDVELHRGERGRERRVHVTGYDDEVRTQLEERPLELVERARRLLGMGPRSDRELDVRLRQRELGEEDVRHQVVVVLTGVDQTLLDLAATLELRVQRRHLHVVRACADDVSHKLALARPPVV